MSTTPSRDEISVMKPEAATALLAELSTAYASSQLAGAGQQADKLVADPAFRDRFLRGDLKARQEMQDALATKLGAGDHLDQVIAGTAKVPALETVSGDTLTTYKQLQAASWMKQDGLPADAIRQIFEGKGVSAAEHAAAVELRATKLGNKDWTAKLLTGDREAVREMELLNIIIVGGVAEEKRSGA